MTQRKGVIPAKLVLYPEHYTGQVSTREPESKNNTYFVILRPDEIGANVSSSLIVFMSEAIIGVRIL
jgi:hypothetical protein